MWVHAVRGLHETLPILFQLTSPQVLPFYSLSPFLNTSFFYSMKMLPKYKPSPIHCSNTCSTIMHACLLFRRTVCTGLLGLTGAGFVCTGIIQVELMERFPSASVSSLLWVVRLPLIITKLSGLHPWASTTTSKWSALAYLSSVSCQNGLYVTLRCEVWYSPSLLL